MSAVRTLLAGLIDDASQFPPARLELEEAIDRHRAARSSAHGWMLGRFLCPASRVEPAQPRPLGVVSDGDWEMDLDTAVAAGAEAFELRDPGPDAWVVLANAPLRVFVEAPRSLDALAEQRLGAKLRCGGMTAESFPGDAAVASFIDGCRRLGLPFKATAGLHHPFRTEDPALGVRQHGFVNLLAATALEDCDTEAVVGSPAEDFAIEEEGLAWQGTWADGDAIGRARGILTAFGCCSFSEPVDDLVAAGVLESARA